MRGEPSWRDLLLPAAGALIALALWQGVVVAFAIPSSELPDPASVLRRLIMAVQSQAFWIDVSQTLAGAGQGLLIGAGAAILAGIVIGELRLLETFVYPVFVWFQAMPIIAVAPLLIVWFGIGLASKVAIVAIAVFFPLFVNTVAGMHAAPAELVELYRGYGASRLRTILDVKLPAALPYIFAGLEVVISMSLTSCVVGEFLAARAGLGFRIRSLATQLDLTNMFALVLVLALLGVIGSAAIVALRRRIVFWHG